MGVGTDSRCGQVGVASRKMLLRTCLVPGCRKATLGRFCLQHEQERRTQAATSAAPRRSHSQASRLRERWVLAPADRPQPRAQASPLPPSPAGELAFAAESVLGFRVESAGGRRIGCVVALSDGLLVVERGAIRKRRHALPESIVMAIRAPDRRIIVRTGVATVKTSPRYQGGSVDAAAVEAHYGGFRW
jgi:hypothetical protein